MVVLFSSSRFYIIGRNLSRASEGNGYIDLRGCEVRVVRRLA